MGWRLPRCCGSVLERWLALLGRASVAFAAEGNLLRAAWGVAGDSEDAMVSAGVQRREIDVDVQGLADV